MTQGNIVHDFPKLASLHNTLDYDYLLSKDCGSLVLNHAQYLIISFFTDFQGVIFLTVRHF